MTQTTDIGAARVRLIIDSEQFDPIIEQGKRAIRGFGAEAEAAYDKTDKAQRRAANALLDYVNSLGRADTAIDKYLRNASRMGVEKPILDAAIQAWQRRNDELEVANQLLSDQERHVKSVQAAWRVFENEQIAFAAEEKRRTEQAARARVEALEQARAATAQRDINELLGVREADPNSGQRRADAEAAFAEIVRQENIALQRQKDLAEAITLERSRQYAENAQRDFNKLFGIEEQKQALNLAQRRLDAEQAFTLQDAQVEAYKANLLQRQAAGESFIKQLKATEVASGKTYYELLRLKAAELGVADAAEPFIARIQKINQEQGLGTISAKQYALALRQLPAQFTDIFTSLAGGQNPLLVILQQGGQIKDMFGDIRTAADAFAKEGLKIATNPYVLLATALVAVGVAAFQATARIEDLAVATASGNGTAGNARGLARLAQDLNDLKDINLASADAAVAKLAESGKLSGQNFTLAAEASARWAAVTGKAVDEVASKFNDIARDPLQAIVDGTVKVTSAQYEQIRALTEAGDQQKAVTELVRIYYEQVNKNSQTVVDNLSNTTKAWREVRDAVTGAFNETGNFFDFLIGASQKANEELSKAPWWQRLLPASNLLAGARALFNVEPPGAAAAGNQVTAPTTTAQVNAAKEGIKLTAAQIKANEDLAKAWDNSGSHAEMVAEKVRKLNATLRNATKEALAQRNIIANPDGTFGGKGYDRLVKALDDRTKRERKVPQGPDPTRAIQERERTALAALKATQGEFNNLYSDRELSVESYYARSLFLARQEADVQIQSNNEQIKALTGRQNSEDKIAALKQKNATVEEQFAIRRAELDRAEVLATRERAAALRDYRDALVESNKQLERQFAQQVRGVGTGSRNSQRANALDNARADFERNVNEIQKQLEDRKISSDEAFQKQLEQFDALVERQRIIRQGYEDMAGAEANWLNGARSAWEDWLDNVNNTAGQVRGIATNAMEGFVAATRNQLQKGKGDWRGYLDNVNAQILDFIIKQQLTKFLKYAGDALKGTGAAKTAGEFFGSLFGSAKGNVFAGAPGLDAYRNTIVSSPTIFPFAKGGMPNLGLMGERANGRPEAIVPLERMDNGDLGVKFKGGGDSKVFNYSQTVVVQGVPDRRTRDQIATQTLGAATRAARRS